ncbi:hypothetical protein [Leuconostoc rapi]|uniref:hypothetical protein n=1 Tax=Leuconostoc rapi TaxID=1406906 RepID=UPI0019569FC0|nr:hypothetical protein [Leuconostoc rapi]MBM7434993.1 hypothetical protein [Leuconostoc rapi]
MQQDIIRIVLIVILWLIINYLYGLLISLILSKIGYKKWQPVVGNRTDPFIHGQLIGNIERSLAMLLVILGNVGALSMIVAIKGFARWGELSQVNSDVQSVAIDKFIIGNLLSLGFPVLVAVVWQVFAT